MHRVCVTSLALSALLTAATSALATPRPGEGGSGASWSATQATGAPDVPQAGDHTSAWAPQQADGGVEWLEVGFGRAVKIAQVRVRETFNPGAVTRVSAYVDGSEVTLWEGRDRTRKAPTFFEVKPETWTRSDRVRVYLDTRKIPGWNEIDAVELVGADGSRQWANSATASSSYGMAMGLVDPLHEIVGREVSLRLVDKWVATGRVSGVHGDWIRLEQQGRTRLINRVHVVDIDFR